METYIFDWDRDTTISNFGDSIADLYEHTFVPKLSACANITYVGMASNGNRREAVFKIKNYTSIYIRICKDDRNDFAGTTDYPKLRLSKSADLSTCNSYYTNDGSVNISYGGQATYYGTGNINMKFNMYVVTDTNNNLKCLWQMKAPGSSLARSQGILIGETENGRDFVAIIGESYNATSVIYLDDSDCVSYRIPEDTTLYNNPQKVLKKNWMPITTTNNINTFIDNMENMFVRIINSDLTSYEGSGGVNKDSASIRKLIQIGNKYYRQITANYWIEDPKGDVTPETITNVTL